MIRALIIIFWIFVQTAPVMGQSAGAKRPAGSMIKRESGTHLDLLIVQAGFSASDYVGSKTVNFTDVCASFGKLLVNNRGLWGTGPFRKFRCALDDGSTQPIPRSWTLKISGDSNQKKFEIFFIDGSGVATLQSDLTLETELTPIVLLGVKRTRSIIGAHLSLGLPFRSIVRQAAISHEGVIKLAGDKLSDLPPPEFPLRIFALNRSKGLWLPVVFGSAEFDNDDPAALQYKINVTDPARLAALRSKSKRAIFYLQQSEGRDEERERLNAAIKSDLGGFLKKFLSIARAVYLGGRFGQPLGKATGVLSKASTVGVFGEFRAGLLQGVKFNYDLIPEVKASTDSTTQKFKWSRIQLGYGFGRRFNNILFNWIDLTPKLGVTSLEFVQGGSDVTGDLGFNFTLQRAPTLGAELGIEKRTPYFLARLWSYGSYSVGMLQVDKKYRSTSIRVGFDVYRDLFSMGSVKLALLGFGASDATVFSRTASDTELEKDPNLVTNLKYQSIYGGGGLTLTW